MFSTKRKEVEMRTMTTHHAASFSLPINGVELRFNRLPQDNKGQATYQPNPWHHTK